MKDVNFIKKAIQWAESHGFKKLKANHEGYETPTQFTAQGEDKAFIPDVTGIQMGGKSYVEIVTKTDNINRRVSKWKLLSTLASMKGGSFFLLAPKGHKSSTETIVKKHHLNAKVIYLKN